MNFKRYRVFAIVYQTSTGNIEMCTVSGYTRNNAKDVFKDEHPNYKRIIEAVDTGIEV